MKYILINDILSFFKKYIKFIISFLVIIISVLFVQILVGCVIDIELLKNMVGLNANFDDGLFPMLMFLLNLGFHLVMIFQIFNNDIKNGEENILLRMSLSKWIFSKLFSIIILNNIVRLIIYILSLFIISIFGINFSIAELIQCYLINIIYIHFIDSIFLVIYAITKKFPISLCVFVISLIFFINIIFVDFEILKENKYIFIIATILMLYIFYLFVKKRIVNILE